MRRETVLIKGILKKFFPNKKYSVRFIQAAQYIDTSDKIRIKIDEEEYNHMCTILNSHTRGIRIAKVGYCTSISGQSTSQIYNVETEQFEDADMLEFIELDTKK